MDCMAAGGWRAMVLFLGPFVFPGSIGCTGEGFALSTGLADRLDRVARQLP